MSQMAMLIAAVAVIVSVSSARITTDTLRATALRYAAAQESEPPECTAARVAAMAQDGVSNDTATWAKRVIALASWPGARDVGCAKYRQTSWDLEASAKAMADACGPSEAVNAMQRRAREHRADAKRLCP